MTADGLLPGQEWAIAPGGFWQARLCRAGRAHVIGLELASDPNSWPWYVGTGRRHRWHSSFDRACRVARKHEAMVIAAKRQEVV